jgi:hypothetical protein
LTVNEFRRLFDALLLATNHTVATLLAWSRWRRRHQYRARLSHYRRREQLNPIYGCSTKRRPLKVRGPVMASLARRLRRSCVTNQKAARVAAALDRLLGIRQKRRIVEWGSRTLRTRNPSGRGRI